MKREKAKAPEPTDTCHACGQKKIIMLLVETTDGHKTLCSGCWKAPT